MTQDFSICAMCKFTVKYKATYCYNTPTYETPNDWHKETVRWKRILSFNAIVNLLSKEFSHRDLFELRVENNCITFGRFDANTGETGDYSYEITFKPENKRRRVNEK